MIEYVWGVWMMINLQRGRDLRERWKREERAVFHGWDFSHIDGRIENEPLPWNYKDIVLRYLEPENELLDIGTGGGEFLLSLGHPFLRTTVTEAWPPNIKLCQDRLSPLGITVVPCGEGMPFSLTSNRFDIVIDRHEAYDAQEVYRILKDGGLFITQQVGAENNRPLIAKLLPDATPRYPDVTLETYVTRLEAVGFDILKKEEYFAKARYMDVGAVVFCAKILEWEFPDFSVDGCFDRLLALQEELETQGYVESIEHRFVIVTRKRTRV